MPNINYQYLSLANINWPGAAAIGGGTGTTCNAAPANGLAGIMSPMAATWGQLGNACVHIGRYPGPAAMNLREVHWRLHTARAAATANGGGFLAGTPLVGAVDPSEQGTLSYFMGSMMTAYVAIVQVGALNFMHLRRYNAINPGFVNYANGLRPDFISRDVGGYQIWEAKGRVGGAAPGIMRKGFRQARAVNQINLLLGPVVPNAYVCCLCRRAPGGTWDAKVTDPAVTNAVGESPEYLGRLYAEYYRPFKEMVDAAGSPQTTAFANATFVIATLEGLDFTIGIDQRVSRALDQFAAKPAQLAEQIGPILEQGYNPQSDPNRYVNGNGTFTAVGDSWLKL